MTRLRGNDTHNLEMCRATSSDHNRFKSAISSETIRVRKLAIYSLGRLLGFEAKSEVNFEEIWTA